jgi:hypothetical protein
MHVSRATYAQSQSTFCRLFVINIAFACPTTKTRRNHTRGSAIVLRLLVLAAFTVLLFAAAPGKKFLEASGTTSDINPMSRIENMYNAENIRCAFGQANCSIIG